MGGVNEGSWLTPDRFKADMWQVIAHEMCIPWRAAEAMHWQMGEKDMAHRAGVVPFSLSSVAIDGPKRKSVRRKSGSPGNEGEGVGVRSPGGAGGGWAGMGVGAPSEEERGLYRNMSPGHYRG